MQRCPVVLGNVHSTGSSEERPADPENECLLPGGFLKMSPVSDVGSCTFNLDLLGSRADLTENGCRSPLVVARFCRLNPDSSSFIKGGKILCSSVVETLLFGLSLCVLFAEVFYHFWSKQLFTRWQISFSSPAHKPLCAAGFKMFLWGVSHRQQSQVWVPTSLLAYAEDSFRLLHSCLYLAIGLMMIGTGHNVPDSIAGNKFLEFKRRELRSLVTHNFVWDPVSGHMGFNFPDNESSPRVVDPINFIKSGEVIYGHQVAFVFKFKEVCCDLCPRAIRNIVTYEGFLQLLGAQSTTYVAHADMILQFR